MKIVEGEFARDLRAAVRTLIERHIQPLIGKQSADQPVDGDTLRAFFMDVAATGLFGAQPPGGVQHWPADLVNGRGARGAAWILGVATVAQEATILRLGHGAAPELLAAYMPDMIAGQLIAASAISEPGVGLASNHEHDASPRDLPVGLAKLWITNAAVADVIVVAARHSDTGRIGGPRRHAHHSGRGCRCPVSHRVTCARSNWTSRCPWSTCSVTAPAGRP